MKTCVFCGVPAEVILKRHSDAKDVPVCRVCVPRGMVLKWAENGKLPPIRGGLDVPYRHPRDRGYSVL